MAREDSEPETRRPSVPRVVYTDAEGQATDNPAAAVHGEIVEYDGHGRPQRRTRFFLAERDIPWLPVGEIAFLIWVLVALMAAWLIVGLVLRLT
jgi:hypothetical protein